MNRIPFDNPGAEKLEMRVFSTIRREDKFGGRSDILGVTDGNTGEILGAAGVVEKETTTLAGIQPEFLMYDTGTKEWEEAVMALNSHYDEDIGMNEKLTIYWLRWYESIRTDEIRRWVD